MRTLVRRTSYRRRGVEGAVVKQGVGEEDKKIPDREA